MKEKQAFIMTELEAVLKACDDSIDYIRTDKSVSYRYETVVIFYHDSTRKIVNVTGCSNIMTLVRVAQAVKNGV